MKVSVAFAWSSTLLLCGAVLQFHLTKRIATIEKADVDVDDAKESLEDLLARSDRN